MTIATDLRAMRDYIERHGFSPNYGTYGCPACFLGAEEFARCNLPDRLASMYLGDFIGNQFEADDLRGWTKRDAIAVLEVAEACAIEEGL